MYNILSGADLKQYKPHAADVSIESSDGTVVGRVAWWSDNPIRDGKAEAIQTIKLLNNYNVIECRVVKVEGKEIFRFSTFDLVQWRLRPEVNWKSNQKEALIRHSTPDLPHWKLIACLEAGQIIICADGTVLRPK